MDDAWARVAENTREETGDTAEGWISAVPAAIPELAERWSLTLGEAYEVGTIAYVLPAERDDGTAAVLKLIYPHYPETPFAQEVAGLRMWDGRGIVRLLEADAEIGAQLLERAVPGTSLLELDEADASPIAAGVLQAMWSAPATPNREIKTLAEQARIWAGSIESDWREAGEPVERELIDEARSTFESLANAIEARAADDLVLVHGDLHHGNVLRAERERWLAIDPKPMLGEPEYDVRAVICDRREKLLADADPLHRLQHRLDTLLHKLEVELDRDRTLGWAFAVSVDWCLWGLGAGDRFARSELETARLLRELRR